MSASVDVLAVMARDAASAFEARHGDREIQEFLGKESDAARAEVAELIEKVDELIKHTSGCEALLRVAQTETLSNAKSALARVKGA